jgi:phosphomannomutase
MRPLTGFNLPISRKAPQEGGVFLTEKIKFGTDGWRAIIADGFTFANVRFVSRAIANHILNKGMEKQGVLVAYDNRFMAVDFARQVAGVLLAAGIPVYFSETSIPTPAAAFAVWEYKTAGAVMLTASHNPPQYMGIKFIPHYAGPAMPVETDDLVSELQNVLAQKQVPFRDMADAGELVKKVDVKKAYLEHLASVVDGKVIGASSLKVVVDPMHGAGAGYIEEFLKGICDVTAIRNTVDPLFGGNLPDPTRKHLDLLVETVAKTGSHLGIALDGDADRLGVVDAEGHFYNPNQILTLFLQYLTRDKGLQDGKVARTVATTHMLDRIAEKQGLEVLETPVGFKYIGAALREQGAFMGGEESGGFSMRGHIPEKDGIMAGLFFAEMLAAKGKTAAELLEEISLEYGRLESRRLDMSCREEEKPAIVEKLQNWQPRSLAGQKVMQVNRVDGVKVIK